MASTLPTAEQVLAALSAELTPANVEVLPAADIHRTETLVMSMRHRGGGLLVIMVKDRVVEPLVRNRLIRHERDKDVEEVVSMEVVEGLLLVGRVPASELRAKRRRLPSPVADPTLIALEEIDLDEIDVRRAARPCPGDGPGVDGSDSDQGRLLALGVTVQAGRQVHPSIAGLAVYGRRPELWLPLQVELVGEGATDRLEGPIPALVEKACEWSGWPTTAPRALVRAMLADAIAWRDWHVHEPIVVRVVNARVRVRVPGMVGVHQPAIAKLMKREGLAVDPARPFGRVDRWLAQRAVAPSSRLRTEAGVDLVIDLPPVDETPAAVQDAPQVTGQQGVRAAPEPAQDTTTRLPHHGHEPTGGATDRTRAVVELLGRRPATTKELMTELGASRFALRTALTVLEAAGRIRPECASRNSPFQRWLLVEDQS